MKFCYFCLNAWARLGYERQIVSLFRALLVVELLDEPIPKRLYFNIGLRITIEHILVGKKYAHDPPSKQQTF